MLGRNDRPVLSGFQWWASLDRFMNSTIKITTISTNPHSENKDLLI